MHVHYFELWYQHEDSDTATAFFESDPVWVALSDLTTFDFLQRELKTWSHTVSEMLGCIDLSNGVSAAPTVGFLEDSCPTTTVLEELHRVGWVPIKERIVHDRAPPSRFDGRHAQGKKYYFQVLLSLERVLALSKQIPSDDVQSYYRVLFDRSCDRAQTRRSIL